MTQINVISRISEDKNAFFDVLYAIRKLADAGNTGIHVMFIGDIISRHLHRSLLQLIALFELEAYVTFSGRSIRPGDLPDAIKNGYFLNFTVGNFMGFSGIEAIKLGFKTIFYNPFKNLSAKTLASAAQAADFDGLVALVQLIHDEPEKSAARILAENRLMAQGYSLSETESRLLNSILLPAYP